MPIENLPSRRALTPQTFRILVVSAAVFAATTLPLLLYLRRLSLFAELSMDAGDASYYLTIARNSQHTPFFTFDGTYPTNGFHPVWQYLLYIATRWHVLSPDNAIAAVHQLYLGNLLILGFGCALFAAFCARQLRREWLAIPAVCPGFLWFAIAFAAPVYLSNWSFLNGMESSIELLCMALAVLTFPTKSAPWLLFASTFLFGLMTLSRLDDVFFLLPVLILVWKSQAPYSRFRAALAITLPLAMIAAYVLYNRIVVGVLLPTSGTVKAGFALVYNLRFVEVTLIPTALSWQWMRTPTSMTYPEVSMRVFQMIVPVIVCAAFLIRRRRAAWGLIETMSVGVILKGLYDLAFVQLFHQGSWYYAVSLAIANLDIAVFLEEALPAPSCPLRYTPSLRGVSGALAGIILLSFCFNTQVNARVAGGHWAENVLLHKDAIRAMVLKQGEDRFIELNDGEITYATQMPALSGTGLALDPQATRALATGHFFDIATQRNYHLIVAGDAYLFDLDHFVKAKAAGQKGGQLNQIRGEEFERYRVVPVAYDPATNVGVYRFTRNP